MKTIGLIGGMSWESTAEYYRVINETVKERCGGLHSSKCILYSVDFEEIEQLQKHGEWDELTGKMIFTARTLERAGADCVVICTNTMHMMADEIQEAIDIPLLHIADAAADEIKRAKITVIGLLGTLYTMEGDFYRTRLREKHGIEVIIPPENDRKKVHDVIYRELCRGTVKEKSKNAFIGIINDLIASGAGGILLGCTEIPLLIKQEDITFPVFDTTLIHARAAVEFALG